MCGGGDLCGGPAECGPRLPSWYGGNGGGGGGGGHV